MKLTERNQVNAKGKIENGEDLVMSLPRVTNAQNKLQMPPGYDATGPNDSFKQTVAGATDVSDRVNDKTARDGKYRIEMKPYDDQYTGEHTDPFYDDPKVDGKSGFVERNNYLDRS